MSTENVGLLITAVSALKKYFEEIRESIDAKVAEMLSLVSAASSDLEVFGDGNQGSTVVNAASALFSEGGNCYLHFKLPLKADENHEMFHLHIRGYAYGEAKVIDATLVGYCYKPSANVINVGVEGSHQPALYKGSDNAIYGRLYFPNCYYLTVAVDTLRVGNGRLLRRGDIEIIKSENETL